MHIIIGGAYNGKKKYIAQKLVDEEVYWCDGVLPISEASSQTVVLYSLEKFIFPMLVDGEEIEIAQTIFQKICSLHRKYEKMYIVLEDRGRGIVPIDRQQRKLRDVLGRLYQLLFKQSQTVTRIWYGLPQQLK